MRWQPPTNPEGTTTPTSPRSCTEARPQCTRSASARPDRDLLAEAAGPGEVRDDVAPDELASYCLHALTAARGLRSKAAVRRLVAVTSAGLRPTQATSR
jgi:hypothetical protein